MTAGQFLDVSAQYRVTGVLAPTGTVLDRLVVTGLESVWAVHEHPPEPARGTTDAKHDAHDDEREVTLALVKFRSPLAAATLQRSIDKRVTRLKRRLGAD